MRKALLLALAFIFMLGGYAMAQNRTISGTVTDADDGSPLPGVNVVVKGSTTGTVTDANGKYQIQIGEGTMLVFSYVGYVTQEVEAGAQSVVDIALSVDSKTLDEVIVVGYGSVLKAESTSAISSVSAEQLSKLPINSPDQVLQGLTSGVFVSASSGTPGGGINIRVRGQTSINASNSPLYVIDGVIVASGNLVQNGVGGQSQNALSSLNPQDIESMQVLKDAASTAIYGARAANGVVLITTKRGKEGKAKVDFRAWTGVAQPTAVYEKMNAADQTVVEREAFYNDNPTLPLRSDAALGWDGSSDTDWIDEIFRDASISEYQLSVSGGNNKLSYYVSGAYRDEQGVIIGSNFDRFSFRSNVDYQATNRLKISSSLAFSRAYQDGITNDNNIYGVYSAAILTPSARPIRDENGEFVDALPSFNTNALRATEQTRQDFTTYRFIGNVNADFQIADGLNFRTDFSYDWNYVREDVYYPVTTAQGRNANGTGTYASRDFGTWLLEPTLRYNKTLNDMHKVSGVLGLTFQQTADFSNDITATGFARPTLTYITDAANFTDGSSFRSDYSFASVFGRVNYSLKERYLLSVSVRRDGSSRFGPDRKFGTFWAVSGGWNFTEEDFFNVDFISFGKLRASYGVTGNDNIGNFQYLGAFSGGASYLGQAASTPTRLGDPALGWEETASLDFGLEMAFFDNRLNLTAGYFQQKTSGLLFNSPSPYTTGFAGILTNIGEVENKGWEFDLSTINVDKGGFKWTTTLNISFLKNKVVDLVNDEPILAGFASAIIEGQPLNTFYGLKWLGVDPGTGVSRFEDLNGDGAITGLDFQVIGDHAPDMLGGITNTISYKGLSLDVFFQFVEGVDVYNNTNIFLMNPSSPWGLSQDMERRWQKPGDITDVPKATRTSQIDFTQDNSRWLSDGSYLRLKNVTLAYSFPNEVAAKMKLRSLRVYVQGQNIWTLTNYNGPDPEVSTFGATNTALGTEFLTFPQAKMYSVGINIGL
jgi:TonB-linked SusC/RagA family outer membrane protein